MNFSSDDTEVPQFPMPGSISEAPAQQRSLPEVERDLMRSGGGYRPSRGILSSQMPVEFVRDSPSPFAEVNPLSSQTFRASGNRAATTKEANLKEAVSRATPEQVGPETLLEIRDLYRSGQRERAFTLLEGFVRAFPHHEPAAKLYRALTLQRRLSSDSGQRDDTPDAQAVRARELASVKTAPSHLVPIVPLGPAEVTSKDTPIPLLAELPSLGIPMEFQLEEDPNAALNATRDSRPASTWPGTGTPEPQPDSDQHSRLGAQLPSQSHDMGTVSLPPLPDFSLEPALEFGSATSEGGEAAFDTSRDHTPDTESSAEAEHPQLSEPIDWTWNSDIQHATSSTADHGQVDMSPLHRAQTTAWEGSSDSFATESASSSSKDSPQLDWGINGEMSIGQWVLPPTEIQEDSLPTAQPIAQDLLHVDSSDGPGLISDPEQLPFGEEIALQSSAESLSQFEQTAESEEITTESALAAEHIQTAVVSETARDALHGFFAPTPELESGETLEQSRDSAYHSMSNWELPNLELDGVFQNPEMHENNTPLASTAHTLSSKPGHDDSQSQHHVKEAEANERTSPETQQNSAGFLSGMADVAWAAQYEALSTLSPSVIPEDPHRLLSENATASPPDEVTPERKSSVSASDAENASEQARQSQTTPQLSMSSILELDVPNLLHTRFLFSLEERLFLCALDGRRSINEALSASSRLPLTQALALLNDLHSEGSVRKVSRRSE